jgi:hypothetical protein
MAACQPGPLGEIDKFTLSSGTAWIRAWIPHFYIR